MYIIEALYFHVPRDTATCNFQSSARLRTHSYPTFNSPRPTIILPVHQLNIRPAIISWKNERLVRPFFYSPFPPLLNPQYHRRISIIVRTRARRVILSRPTVFLSQLYDTFVKLSNECPSISRRALFHFFKRAKSRPPYTASIKSPRRNFPRERVSLMRRSRNANARAGCLSLRKRDAQTPRCAPGIAMAVIRRAMKRME